MVEIWAGLWVGSGSDCVLSDYRRWVVHACKSPCHQRILGYEGKLDSRHPHYLAYRRGDALYLNMIDPDKPLFMAPMFWSFLKFAAACWSEEKELLIHCNQGLSRAPSLALIFMAKRYLWLNGWMNWMLDRTSRLGRSLRNCIHNICRVGGWSCF